jgi:hypothetical protein
MIKTEEGKLIGWPKKQYGGGAGIQEVTQCGRPNRLSAARLRICETFREYSAQKKSRQNNCKTTQLRREMTELHKQNYSAQ